MITPQHYLLLGSFLFATGMAIVIVRKQPTIVLMGLGLMFNATTLALAALTRWFQDWSGQVAALLLVTVTVAELAAGISFVWAYTRAVSARTKEQDNDQHHQLP